MESEDNDTSLEISDLETQFVPREDDEETLYRVLEITAEKAGKYKVKWAGIDPKTKKPWAQSWVDKHDCTDDLVVEWKTKKARKRASTANTPVSGMSKVSRSKSTESPSVAAKAPRRKQSTLRQDAVWDEPLAGPSVKKRKKRESSHNPQPVSRPIKRQRTKDRDGTSSRSPVGDDSSDDNDERDGKSASGSSRRRGQEGTPEIEDIVVSSKARKDKGKRKAVDEDQKRFGTKLHTKKTRSPVGQEPEDDPSDSGSDNHTPSPPVGKPRPRSKQFVVSSQDHEPSPSSPSFGKPYLLHNTENEDHDATPEGQASSAPHTKPSTSRKDTEGEQEDEDEGEGEAIPIERQYAKFPPRAAQRRSKDRPSGISLDTIPHGVPDTPPRNSSQVTPPSPMLSPGAQARLKDFDEFCRQLDEEEKTREEAVDESPTGIPSKYLARRGTSETDYNPTPPDDDDARSPPDTPSSPAVSEEPAHQETPPLAKRPSAADESFETVPETETQSSTETQYRSPERITLVSKMKTRSPSKASLQSLAPQRSLTSSEADKGGRPPRGKALKPVPVVSPSSFAPYIPSAGSEPETDVEDEEQDDTIDEFPSPEKPEKRKGKTSGISDLWGKGNQEQKDREDHARVRVKGMEIYDRVRNETRAQNGDHTTKKKSLDDILKPHAEQAAPAAAAQPVDEVVDDHLIPEEPANMDLDMSLSNLRYPTPGGENESPVSPKAPPNGLNGVNHEASGDSHGKHNEELQKTLKEVARLEQVIATERSQKDVSHREYTQELDEKSERITRLERVIATDREEKLALSAKISALEEALVAAAAAARVAQPEPVQVDPSVIEELKASLQKAESDKMSLEKDRDFFREEWAKASGFVTSVRAENAELEKRAQIAETQAKDGVAMVRATFEDRLKFLEENVRHSQRLANFIMEKDQRTNDNIRKRAAQEPELRRQLEQLEAILENRDLRIEELEHQEKELVTLKAEAFRLSVELNELKDQRNREGRPAEMEGPDTRIFRCQFRNGQYQCQDYFRTLKELEDHIYYSEHGEPSDHEQSQPDEH